MSLQDAFARIKEGQAEPEQTDIEEMAGKPIPRELQLAAARKVVAEGRKPVKPPVKKAAAGLAKSTNPDYVQLKVYVHGVRRRQAAHKWENEGGRDMSDLIEKLLDQYLSS